MTNNTYHTEDTTTMQRDDDHRQGRSLFLRTMCDDAKSSSSTTIEGDDDDASKRRGCARIRVDGSIVSSSSSNDDKAADFRFSTAFCLPPSSSHRGTDDYHSVGGIGNERQMKTVARLSAIQLVGRRGNAAMANDDNTTSSSSDDTTAIGKSRGSGAGVGRWYESMTQKVNRIIDVALATLDGSSAADDEMRYLDNTTTNHAAVAVGKRGDDENEEDDVNNVKKLLLATESSNMPNNVKVDCDDDNNVGEGDQTSVEVEICDTDTVIDVITLATTCRSILTYIHQLISSLDDELRSNSSNGDKFFIPRSSGCKDNSQQRIMLHRAGWGSSSFGSLCLRAAKSQGSSSTILSNISQDVDLELIVQTLIESNYALVHGGENGDVITIYPHGIPRPPPTTTDNNAATEPPSEKKSSSLSSSSSSVIDMALFQIHNTKITIQTRMTQLEHNATQSKIAAMKSQRSGMTQIALRHMRHHKLLIDEISHCATLLTNLDTMELRLCRTEDDKQIVHSYTLVKEAYQMIRKSATGIDGVDDVDELIMDIQDEMDEIDEVGRSMMMTNLSSSVVDSLDDVEDELNVEFHRLELECKEERQQQQQQRQRPKVEKVDTKEDDKLEPLLLAAVTEQPNDGVSEISNVRQSQPVVRPKLCQYEWEGG